MHHSNSRLSIYGMGDVPAFMIKGDAPLVMHIFLYLRNRRRAIVPRVSLLSCVSLYLRNQRRTIGTRVSLLSRVSLYLHNQRRAIGTRISLLLQKWARLRY
jgi:hypothetical protein